MTFGVSTEDSGGIDRARLLRSTRKKLGQIRDLEGRALSSLDQNQRLKLATRPAVEAAVQLLETGGPLEDALSLLAAVGEARAGGSNVQGEASAVAGSVGGASSAGTPGSALSLTVHGQTGEKKQQRVRLMPRHVCPGRPALSAI